MAEFRLESHDTTPNLKKVIALDAADMIICEIEIERVPSGEILIDVYPGSRQHSYTVHHLPALIAALAEAERIAAQWAVGGKRDRR